MAEIKNRYPGVIKNGLVSYGGNQMWSDNAAIRKCGCGLVAALDITLYACRFHGGGGKLLLAVPAGNTPTPLPVYNKLLISLWKKYLPVVPPVGINHAVLTLGLNRLFRDEHIPLKAHVGLASDKMWDRIETSLLADLPVILAIGQNFPYVWQKNKLSFHVKQPDGRYPAITAAKAHFVTITGMDEERLQISSWGNKYYVNRIELKQYIKAHSTSFISGIVYMTKET